MHWSTPSTACCFSWREGNVNYSVLNSAEGTCSWHPCVRSQTELSPSLSRKASRTSSSIHHFLSIPVDQSGGIWEMSLLNPQNLVGLLTPSFLDCSWEVTSDISDSKVVGSSEKCCPKNYKAIKSVIPIWYFHFLVLENILCFGRKGTFLAG